MPLPNGNDSSRLDRIECSIEALASTAADFFSKLAEQHAESEAKHEARMAVYAERMTEIQAKQAAQLNEHEEVLLDHEEEHRKLLRAQVLIADAQRRTEHALAEATEKLNGLIGVVDDFIRRQPKQ